MISVCLPLYIDPGTGSMLFSLFIGLAAAGIFALRTAFLKIRFIISGGRASKATDTKNIPFVIFSDHKFYWNVFHALCDEFEKHGTELTYYTCSPNDPALAVPYKYVHAEYLGEKNKPYARMNLLHADIVLATTPGLGVYQWKRSRYVKWYVHIQHCVRAMYSYRMFGVDHFDAILASGENQVVTGKELEALRPNTIRKEYTIVGSPVMDNILAQKNLSKQDAKNSGTTVVLVAPSWGKSGILSKFGASFLDALKNTGYEIIVRPHPQSSVVEAQLLRSLEKQFPDIEFNYDNDNFAVLNRADILISDFSGTMFDFALCFDKPVIYTDVKLDTAPYDSAWIDGDIWELRSLPKFGVKLEEKDFERIGEVIQSAMNSKNLQQGREDVRAECWENIGGSAKAIFDYLMAKEKELKGAD